MEINNEFGKFTIKKEGHIIIIDAWQGETKKFNEKRIPISEISDCLNWLSDDEKIKLSEMVGAGKYNKAVLYAKKMNWID
jgi:hypothetical protein